MLTKLTGLVAIAAAFLAFGGQTASAEEVLLRSKQSGKYVTVANGLLAASAGSADRALRDGPVTGGPTTTVSLGIHLKRVTGSPPA